MSPEAPHRPTDEASAPPDADDNADPRVRVAAQDGLPRTAQAPDTAGRPRPSAAFVGIGLKVLSAMFFTVMLTLVKVGGDTLPVGQLLFARNLFGLVPVLIVVVVTHHLHDALKTKHPFAHARRAMTGMLAMGFWFMSLQHLPLSEATAIVYASPLMVVVLAAFVLGETVRIYRWTAVALGFVGVIIVLIPQLRGGFDVTEDAAALGALFALLAAVFMAVTSMFVRQLATREPTITVVLYFLIAGLAVTSLTAPTWVWPTPSEMAILVGIGLCGGVGQLLLTRAYRHAEASLVAPFEYTSMIWVVSLGYFVFGDWPSIYTMVGAAIVIASGIFVILRERRLGLQREERRMGAPLRP